MHRSGVRIPLSPPRQRLGLSCTRKGLTSTVKPFSYVHQAKTRRKGKKRPPLGLLVIAKLTLRSFCSRRLIVTISGVRNNVALRFTTLTAEGHGRTNPLISTTFRTWRMCQVFFCIAHASLRSTTNNRRTNSFEPFAQPTVAKIATQRWLQCTTFCFIIT